MKTATVRQLRTQFPRIERWLAGGENVTITKRKVIVAQLVAPHRVKPDFIQRFSTAGKPASATKGAVDLLVEERGA